MGHFAPAPFEAVIRLIARLYEEEEEEEFIVPQ